MHFSNSAPIHAPPLPAQFVRKKFTSFSPGRFFPSSLCPGGNSIIPLAGGFSSKWITQRAKEERGRFNYTSFNYNLTGQAEKISFFLQLMLGRLCKILHCSKRNERFLV
jgi:hypothetical protein